MNSEYECLYACGRKFESEAAMLYHVERRHTTTNEGSKGGTTNQKITKMEQANPSNKPRLIRPKLPHIPQKPTNQVEVKPPSESSDMAFRDSKIDFHKEVLPPVKEGLSQIAKQKLITMPKRSSSKQSKEGAETQRPLLINQQFRRPNSSSQIFSKQHLPPQEETKQVKEVKAEEPKVQQIQYTTTQILENKKKITKQQLFQHGGYEQLDKITHLLLREKDLIVFESTQDVDFRQLISLKSISLSHNKLINIIGITQIHNLLELNINHNQIVDLSPINSCKILQRLWANNNLVETVQNIGVMIHLEVLTLANNKIKSFDDITKLIQQLPSLRELEVTGNPCTNRHEYKYDLIYATCLEKLDGLSITGKDQLLAKAFQDTKKGQQSQTQMMSQSFYVNRPGQALASSQFETDFDDPVSAQSEDDGDSVSSRQEALEEAYQTNFELREKLDKLENQNLELRREIERIPFLEQEVFELRKQVQSYQLMMVLKDSPEAELKLQLMKANEMIMQLQKQNQYYNTEDPDLINTEAASSVMRVTGFSQINPSMKEEEVCISEESDDDKYFKEDDDDFQGKNQELMDRLMRNSLALSQMKMEMKQL